MGYIKTLKEAEQLLVDAQAFNAGSLTAYWITDDTSQPDRYVVNSYGVAIAIRQADREPYVFGDAYNHSKTTSKHANIVKRAWGLTK